MKNVFVLGSLNTDLVIKSPYMPKSGETLTGSDFKINFGGKGANQAVACGKMGAKVYMGGVVGNDVFGKNMLDNLKSFNVNTDNIRTAQTNTGTAVIIVIEGDNRIILDGGANSRLTIEDTKALLKNANEGDIFIAQLENPIDVVGESLKLAKEKGLFVILNPAPANKNIKKYLPYVDLFIPNESELELFTTSGSTKDRVKELNLPNVLVTLGGKGQYYYSKEKEFTNGTIKIKPVDTTAAGDTFCGALAYKLSIGEEIEKAVNFAGVVASLTCTKEGAQNSIPTIDQVNEFIENLNK